MDRSSSRAGHWRRRGFDRQVCGQTGRSDQRGNTGNRNCKHFHDAPPKVGLILTVNHVTRCYRHATVNRKFRLQPGRCHVWIGSKADSGDAMMRTMLYEAAQSMLRSTRWSWLKAWAMQIAKRRGMKRAIVALARRLAVIMHRIWVDGTEFRWTREAAAT
jgi:hypothetical protein